MIPKWTKSEPKGSPKNSQIQVFYVKNRKKGATKDPSVHWESISWATKAYPKICQNLKPEETTSGQIQLPTGGGGRLSQLDPRSEGDQGEIPEGISQPVDPGGVGGFSKTVLLGFAVFVGGRGILPPEGRLSIEAYVFFQKLPPEGQLNHEAYVFLKKSPQRANQTMPFLDYYLPCYELRLNPKKQYMTLGPKFYWRSWSAINILKIGR